MIISLLSCFSRIYTGTSLYLKRNHTAWSNARRDPRETSFQRLIKQSYYKTLQRDLLANRAGDPKAAQYVDGIAFHW